MAQITPIKKLNLTDPPKQINHNNKQTIHHEIAIQPLIKDNIPQANRDRLDSLPLIPPAEGPPRPEIAKDPFHKLILTPTPNR
jgi:hypothetical protein